MTLTGKWASSVDYGYAILNIYRHMLEWALAQRASAAGL
jgi:hypothetical protein